jgi:hypothetical protein
MTASLLIELLKIAFLVLITLLTAWLHDYYTKRRRGESYREHVFKERLGVYRELWQRYVRLTRMLGTKGASLTAIGVQTVQSRLPSGRVHVGTTTDVGSTEVPTTRSLVESITSDIDDFVSYARGSYILLDIRTVEALELIIQLIEGKTQGDGLRIDWGALHSQSFALQDAIRTELGIDQLRDLKEILGAQSADTV